MEERTKNVDLPLSPNNLLSEKKIHSIEKKEVYIFSTIASQNRINLFGCLALL